jgi:hypothetical protein
LPHHRVGLEAAQAAMLDAGGDADPAGLAIRR